MRIASVLADEQWHSVEDVKHRFLEEGWNFTSTHQLTMLLEKTAGIEKRFAGNSRRKLYRLNNRRAFNEFMLIDVPEEAYRTNP